MAAASGKTSTPARTEPWFQALRDGLQELRLMERVWQGGHSVLVGYTIDTSDHTRITQKRDNERKRHAMRGEQRVLLHWRGRCK